MTEHVLVVDDDPSIRMLVREILTLDDYAVETVADGMEALQAIERDPPCAMVLDMRMPVLDGWGVARSLRERHCQVPTVVITAAENAKEWCDEIGADVCIGKPFDVGDLLDAVAQVCSPSQ